MSLANENHTLIMRIQQPLCLSNFEVNLIDYSPFAQGRFSNKKTG